MRLSEFSYHLPKERIAQTPIRPRDHSRLMVLETKNSDIRHMYFFDILSFLQRGDVLVFNNSKVIPARLYGKKETEGAVEILLVRQLTENRWSALLKHIRVHDIGKKIIINGVPNLTATLSACNKEYVWEIEFNKKGVALRRALHIVGSAPTPPYVHQISDLKKYQTVYAKHEGSVAAPTAGFHFTKPLLAKLRKKGVSFCEVTLHVGPGTFSPIRTDDITHHVMHPEYAILSKKTAKLINTAKKKKRRIICVGTTSVRVLESFADRHGILHAGEKDVNLFIYPGFCFKIVTGMITNFHLPQSTLLLLVCAFTEWKHTGGKDFILSAYHEAIQKNYRFYSFGDAMLIL
ncbi:tRNA preQ1(34) S-adenosylmethionine ribosyltransferase-isomerase QueA [Candidatus Uhrbacteria bacterium]|nr:tRNA preQ1(34) S-adenosylmethionine ribosyltransferase-isomerase QueA [Candidatus Uhrbacteria bacterium]